MLVITMTGNANILTSKFVPRATLTGSLKTPLNGTWKDKTTVLSHKMLYFNAIFTVQFIYSSHKPLYINTKLNALYKKAVND